MSKVKETDFFKQINIFITDNHREKFSKIKDITTLSNNVSVDNSTFIRAMLDYLYDNQRILDNIKEYVVQNKGATYLTKFQVAEREGKSAEDISKLLGVDEKTISKLMEKSKG